MLKQLREDSAMQLETRRKPIAAPQDSLGDLFLAALKKRGFNPNQPRCPNGQWGCGMDFKTLWSNYLTPKKYPTQKEPGKITIWGYLGGHVALNGNSGVFKNSCAIRLSYVLNQSGIKIPFIQGQTVSDKNHDWYFHSISDLQVFLNSKLGKPQQFTPDNWRAGIGDQTGILIFQNHWDNATGHIDLYDGSKGNLVDGNDHDYSGEDTAYGVLFYPVK